MASEKVFDLLIVGGGPAGLTAAIYAARYALDVALISKETGGLAAMAHRICNYPGFRDISGFELMSKISEQVKDLGVPIFIEEVKEIIKDKDIFIVKTLKKEYRAKQIIFAAGMKRRKLNIEGEVKLYGRGISYCATCDACFYKNKVVSVIGGSDAALSAAILLAEYASKVYIIYRRDKFFRAEPAWVKLVEKEKKISSLFNEELVEIMGDKKVEKIKLKSGKIMPIDGVFIEIGSEPDLSILKNLDVANKNGFILTDQNQMTNIEGLYAAGDITNNELKQIVTAEGQGATAAYSCFEKLKKSSG
jgi:thioredoxin reductase (NADPH)